MRILLSSLALLVLAACNATSPTHGEATPSAEYVFVFLRSGAKVGEKSADERKEIQAAHLANIHRLAEERALLLAGPFGKPMPDPTLRGIFVFDRADVAEAQRLTETDPAVQAGVLALEAHPWTSSIALREIPRLEADAALRRKVTKESGMRMYAMLVAEDAARAVRALAPLVAQDEVLIDGRLGGELAGREVFVLDAATIEDADALLAPLKQELGAHALYPWWATDTLVALPAIARGAGR